MKTISILVLEGCTPIASIGAMELFNKAGVIHQQLNNLPKPYFKTQLVSPNGQYVKATGDYPIYTHIGIDKLTTTDLLLIPAMEFDIEDKMQANAKLIPHLKRLHNNGAEIGSMCTGAFLLGASGLLDKKKATTHWALADPFRQMYPQIDVQDERVIIDEGDIYTCGGATSFMNLVLYLTEKYCGKETAAMTSRMLMLDFDKAPQSSYMMFQPQTTHNDEAIKKAQQIIEQSERQNLSVEQLAKSTGLSQRNFIRRFKAATGNTPSQYMQRMTIEKAKRMLETQPATFEQIVYELGYSDVNNMRNVFKKHTGLTPKAYKSKFAR
jgi:transcriptional regulator GlxA family with amidase domain